MIILWLTSNNRDLENFLELESSRPGPQLRALYCVNPSWDNDQHYTTRLTTGRRDRVM